MVGFWEVFVLMIWASISPGADTAMIIRQSLNKGAKAGILTALGIGVGLIIHISYCIFGLGILLQKSIFFLNLLKILGGCYLIYLAVILIKSNGLDPKTIDVASQKKEDKNFWIGFLINVTNVKAALFMVSIFAIVLIDSSISAKIGYGFLFVFLNTAWYILLSLLCSHKSIRFNLIKYSKYIDKILGIVMFLFGIIVIRSVKLD
jgi:threonine/homoserine/homoserine lactone efflux protein